MGKEIKCFWCEIETGSITDYRIVNIDEKQYFVCEERCIDWNLKRTIEDFLKENKSEG